MQGNFDKNIRFLVFVLLALLFSVHNIHIT